MNTREVTYTHLQLCRCFHTTTHSAMHKRLPSPHSSLPHSCTPLCILTRTSCVCSSAPQAEASTFQLPLSTCKTYALTHRYVLQSVHTHQTQHLHMAPLRILSWRQEQTQRVHVVLAFKVSESF